MNRAAFKGVVLVCVVCIAWSQKESSPQPYADDEAYRVYEAIIPREESYSFAKGTLIIQSETGSVGGSTHGCLSEDAARKFKTAAADFATVNKKSRPLQSKFHLSKPYQLLSRVEIQQYFKERGPNGWSEFYEQHPASGGFITLSAVGFNKAKSLAVVYAESSCGGLCGSFTFHLLEKAQDKWKEVNGVTCVGAS
jgi:hypothetical protein